MTDVPQSEPKSDTAPTATTRGAQGGLKRTAVRNGLWAMVALVGNRGLSFLTVAVLSRLLFEDYGAIAALMTVLFFVEAGLGLGLGSALIYEQEEGQTRRVDVAFTTNLGMALAVGVVVILAAPALGSFFQVEEYDDMFRLLGAGLLFRGFSQIPDALLKRDLRFRARTAVDLSRGLTRMVVALGLAAAGMGVMAAAWGLFAAEVVAAVGFLSQAHYRPRLRFDWPIAKSMLRFGLAILAIRLVGQVAVNGDYLIVGHQLGDTALGFYYNAFRLPELAILAIYLVFSDVSFPVYAKARSDEGPKLRSGMLASLELLCLYGFPAAVGLALNAESAILVVFGEGWEPSVEPMIAVSLAAGIMAIAFASGDIYTAIGRPSLLLTLIVIHIPIQFAILLYGANWGITGVAWAQLVSLSLATVVRVGVAARVIDVPVLAQARATVPGLIAAAGVLLLAVPTTRVLDPGLVSLVLGTMRRHCGCCRCRADTCSCFVRGRLPAGLERGAARRMTQRLAVGSLSVWALGVEELRRGVDAVPDRARD